MPRCPFAVWKPISGSSGPHTGGPYKIVHHTTEGSTAAGAMAAFVAHRSDPHFTVDATTIYQHVDTAEGARALRNEAGGVQTNRDSAVQIELVGFAHLPKNPQSLTQLARLCRWIEGTHQVPRIWPSGPPKPAKNGKDPGGHNRNAVTWDSTAGHYGHCHVPENDHWDPAYTAAEAAFVLAAAFDAAGRLVSPALAVSRGASSAAAPGPARSTMPGHHDVGESVALGPVASKAPKRKEASTMAKDSTAPKTRKRAPKKAAPPPAEGDGTPLQAALHRPRICFERIVPDAQDPERHVRRAMRSQMIAAAGRRLDAEQVLGVTRMALVASKRWGPGHVVRCRFLDGSKKMQAKVREHAKVWEQHANVKIAFVTKDPAEVRISFYADDGSWSAVGRDALNASYFPLHQPTMNFGWVRDDSDATEDRAVVLHEFGHALGCIHEHQSPTFERTWNRAAVLKYFRGPPNYWDDAAIESNVLAKYSPRGIKATVFDPKSIMLYSFGAELFADGEGPTNENSTLSATDKQMIKKMYLG